MWPFRRKTTSSRQKEIRRSKAERRQPLLQRINAVAPLPFLGIGIATAILAGLIVDFGGEALTLREGQYLERALTARVDFAIKQEQQTSIKRGQARNTSPNYYVLETALVNDIRGRLSNLLTIAETYKDEPAQIRENAANINITLDEAGLEELVRLAHLEDASEYQRAINIAMETLRNQPLIEPSPRAAERTPTNLVLRDPQLDVEKTLSVDEGKVADQAGVEIVASEVAAKFPRPLRPSIEQSLKRILTGPDNASARHIYRYDAQTTTAKAEAAAQAVEPVYLEYAVDSVIAQAGVITTEEFDVLQQEHEAWRAFKRSAELDQTRSTVESQFIVSPRLSGFGRSLLALIAVLGLVVHYLINRHSTKINLSRMATTAGVLLALLAVTRVLYAGSTTLPAHVALSAQAFAAALLVVVYRRHQIVLPLTLTLGILMTLATQQGVGFFFVLFAVSGTIAIALSDVRKRGQVVTVGVLAALVAAATTVVAGLIAQQTLSFVVWQIAWAAGSTLAAMFLIEGLLPTIERIFKLSTSLTLLEWCDATKPLQRMMAAEAPGTYTHSMQVGALAESAADAIGANGLLCRAGAYYHDIGKINKPEYFVENQALTPNRHDRLSPAMSLLIIIGHVKDGIEMAKEYGLPHDLRPFIAEHHGTTLVEYFYHAASRSRRPDDPAVSDTEFRYPGPKPQTRESGILMLCDGVEGAVRAMPEPTPNRIEDTVKAIVQKRLMDGQFDECDLTFREIGIIRNTLVKTLCAIYHSRIQYPTDEKNAEPPKRGVGA